MATGTKVTGSKRYRSAVENRGEAGTLALAEAMEKVLAMPGTKFDETVDLAVRLGVDPKKSDQTVRGSVLLPQGTGKKVRITVIAQGDNAQAAKDAGADEVGDADLIKKISEGYTDFDVLLASPDMMKDMSKLGPVLGPRGLMPNPKTGTLSPKLGEAVAEFRKGRARYKVDAGGVIHAGVGKVSQGGPALVENAEALMQALLKARPASAKGAYIRSLNLSRTMGPSVAVDVSAYQ